MMNMRTAPGFSATTESPFFFDDVHHMLRDQLRRFVAKDIKPHADAWEADGVTPRTVLREMGRLGFFGIRYPERYGGSSLDERATVVLAEELGRCTYAGVAITALVHTDMASVHIFNAGTEAQKDRYMKRVVSGDLITAVAITEPDAGSDVKGIRTTAVRDGDAYVLNGAKTFITNGVHADLVCVAAKTGGDGEASRAVTMFIVEKGTEGFHVARALDKHGWRSSSDTAELVFEDCYVPAENHARRGGARFLRHHAATSRTSVWCWAPWLWARRRRRSISRVDYVRTRKAFGAPLWEKQAIRQRLAMLVGEGRGRPADWSMRRPRGTAAGRGGGASEVSMIKAYCGELVNEVMYDCRAVPRRHGLYARKRHRAHDPRCPHVQAIGGGATEVMLEEVAKRM